MKYIILLETAGGSYITGFTNDPNYPIKDGQRLVEIKEWHNLWIPVTGDSKHYVS